MDLGFDPHGGLVAASQVAMGFALAATCGLRAFLPLFTAAVLARLGYVQLAPAFAWLAGGPALVVFGSAVAIELLGDKFPVVDHALDAAGLLVKPTAATLLAASMFTRVDPVLAVVLGFAAGGTVAGGVHLLKLKLRLASTLFTAGLGNPFLSLAEDLASVLFVAFAVLLPVLAALAVASVLLLATILLLARLNRERPRQTAP